jgi:hypothetical protein
MYSNVSNDQMIKKIKPIQLNRERNIHSDD